MTVPYIFATATGNVALAELDANFESVYLNVQQAEYANVANSVAGPNVIGIVDHAYYADRSSSANSVLGSHVIGSVQQANIANVANRVAGSNVVGTVESAIYSVHANYAESSIQSIYADYCNTFTSSSLSLSGNIEAQWLIGNLRGSIANAIYADSAGTANYATFAGTAFSIAGANVTGYVANASHATVANRANAVTGSNVSGQVANALVAGTVYGGYQPYITSVGVLTDLTAGDISISGNSISPGTGPLSLSSDVKITGNLQVLGNVTYVNSNSVSTGNLIINLAATALTPSAANASGIQIGNTKFANVLYSSTQNAWVLSNVAVAPGFSTTGNVVATRACVTGNVIAGNLVTTGAVNLGGWSVTPSGNKLYFSYGTSQVGSLDEGGNFIVAGNVTAFGTP
jgi:hypothetical protein